MKKKFNLLCFLGLHDIDPVMINTDKLYVLSRCNRCNKLIMNNFTRKNDSNHLYCTSKEIVTDKEYDTVINDLIREDKI